MARNDEQYEVFVSYRNDRNSTDKVSAPIALDIKQTLEASLYISTFIDQQNILVGDDFMRKIKDQVQRTRVVVCILSREFFESDYCTFEFTEAKKQRKLVAFASSPDFNPADHALTESEKGSIPNLSSWDRTLKDPNFRRHLETIARMIDRPKLVGLADALANDDDDRVIDWCENNSTDIAAKEHLDSIFLKRLQEREAINRDARRSLDGKIAAQLRNLKDQLEREQKELVSMRSKVLQRKTIEPADCRSLAAANAVETDNLSSEDTVSKALVDEMSKERDKLVEVRLTLESDLATERARSKIFESQLQKHWQDEQNLKKEIERLHQKIAEATSDDDVVADIIATLSRSMPGPCKDNVRKAGHSLRTANDCLRAAERARSIIDDAIRSGRATPIPPRQKGAFEMRYVDAEAGAPGRYLGRLDLPTHLGDDIRARTYWGYFDDDSNFKGPGVIHFNIGNKKAFSYFGQLEKLEPEDGEPGVFVFDVPGHRHVRWEGTWPKTFGFGRLVRSDGTQFFGKVRMPDFGEFLEDDHGVIAHSGPNKNGDLYSYDYWQMGRRRAPPQ